MLSPALPLDWRNWDGLSRTGCGGAGLDSSGASGGGGGAGWAVSSTWTQGRLYLDGLSDKFANQLCPRQQGTFSQMKPGKFL